MTARPARRAVALAVLAALVTAAGVAILAGRQPPAQTFRAGSGWRNYVRGQLAALAPLRRR